jgi:hypothetical protein
VTTLAFSRRSLRCADRDDGNSQYGESEQDAGDDIARVMHAPVYASHADRGRCEESDDPTDETYDPRADRALRTTARPP